MSEGATTTARAEPMPDERMLWLREIEALATCEHSDVIEAELGSEVLVFGLFEYADDAIRLRPVTFEPDQAGLYKYVLRLRIAQRTAPKGQIVPQEYLRKGTSDGYVFPEGLIGELVALLSLCVQARFFTLSTSLRLRQGGEHDEVIHKTEKTLLRGRHGARFDRVVFSEMERRTTHLGPLLDKIRRVSSAKHHKLAVSADHYARALRTIGVDEEMVFVRLVSAVEKAMEEHATTDSLGEKLLRLEGLSKSETDELKTMLRARRAGARFSAFLEKYSVGFFEGEAREPAHIQVTPETLGAWTKAIYGARSGYLHAGDPMYISRIAVESPAWHSDPTVGMTWDNRTYSHEQKLPCADFFHRFVRHCLLARIDELATVSPSGMGEAAAPTMEIAP